VWLAEAEREILPDNVIARLKSPSSGQHTTAVIEVDEPQRIARLEVEIREPFLEIRDVQGHQLVCGIEFLSPTNKTTSKGRKLYRKKQRELRQSRVHLVEVDLIRRGPHMLDVPLHIVEAMKPWEYFVNLVRRGGEDYEVYPIRLHEPLPRIRIPLRDGDADAGLNLQEVFTRCYDAGPYPERLEYESPPPQPSLSEDELAWADQILKQKGLRA
jgi:hypothetical protein